jgi:hypothetical protein
MNQAYNNLPSKTTSQSAIVQAYDAYTNQPLEIDASTLDAMRGFFTGKGFDKTAADSVSVTIIKQAKKDGYNPMSILDSLKGLDNVELSALVAEIINYNRFKTSFLGYALAFSANQEIARNIQA